LRNNLATPSPCADRLAAMSATAHDAMRDSRESARLVNTIGLAHRRRCRRLRHRPIHQLLRGALPPRGPNDQDIGGAGDAETMPLCGRPPRHGVVERERSVEHGSLI
jgi:hypothetical protein